jgi:hypothetical protein
MVPSTNQPCRALVERAAAYGDGALPSAERASCDEHVRTCPACRTYLAQMTDVVQSLGELGRDGADEDRGEKARLVQLFRTRGLHSPMPRERTIPLGIAEALAAPGDHIACFAADDHALGATAGFLAAGLERDEVCVLLGHVAANARILAALERRGLRPADMRRRRRLHIVPGQQAAAAQLREIDERVRTAVDEGVPFVRVLRNLGWEHPGGRAVQELRSLEARLTDTVRNFPSIVVCAFDVRGLSRRQILRAGFECHPLTLRHGALWRNEPHDPAQGGVDGSLEGV